MVLGIFSTWGPDVEFRSAGTRHAACSRRAGRLFRKSSFEQLPALQPSRRAWYRRRDGRRAAANVPQVACRWNRVCRCAALVGDGSFFDGWRSWIDGQRARRHVGSKAQERRCRTFRRSVIPIFVSMVQDHQAANIVRRSRILRRFSSPCQTTRTSWRFGGQKKPCRTFQRLKIPD